MKCSDQQEERTQSQHGRYCQMLFLIYVSDFFDFVPHLFTLVAIIISLSFFVVSMLLC